MVRFQDGTIMHYKYYGTSDICIPALYPTHRDLLDAWDVGRKRDDDCQHEEEPVEIYSSYGSGLYWKGTACRKCNQIIQGLDPYYINEYNGIMREGLEHGDPPWIEEGEW